MDNRNQPVIALVNGLEKSYAGKKALRGISLEIREGQLLSVLGPNGAGKTTLINLLLGRLSADKGSMNVFGLTPGSIELKRQCGAMLQVSNLPDTSTVKEHITLFQSYYPNPMAYAEVIRFAGLEDVEKCYSKSLSGGQKQRLLFALAICGNPKLLFLDEPSVGMDIAARKRLWQAIKSMQSKGTSIVLTTHYLEEADFLSDRIIMLNQGKIIQEGTPEAIKSQVNCKKIELKCELSITQLCGLPGVRSVEQKGAKFELQTSSAARTLRQLFMLSNEVSELEISGAALEDAFLQLNQAEENSQDAA